jgi:hypothetical protein
MLTFIHQPEVNFQNPVNAINKLLPAPAFAANVITPMEYRHEGGVGVLEYNVWPFLSVLALGWTGSVRAALHGPKVGCNIIIQYCARPVLNS